MSRLIDADALMERFAEMQKAGETDGIEYACNFMSAGQEPSAEWYTIEDAVDNAPTVDAVPVVRCRDCKYWDRTWETQSGYHFCPMIGLQTTADWYCAYGKRREEDEK